MDYKVLLSIDAKEELEEIVRYLLFEKRNEQAAKNVLNDFEETKDRLAKTAGSLKFCNNPRLKELGYKRINFVSHRYFMIFHIEDDIAYVDNIFHELQDYESSLQ